jgi:hypothetical protein
MRILVSIAAMLLAAGLFAVGLLFVPGSPLGGFLLMAAACQIALLNAINGGLQTLLERSDRSDRSDGSDR